MFYFLTWVLFNRIYLLCDNSAGYTLMNGMHYFLYICYNLYVSPWKNKSKVCAKRQYFPTSIMIISKCILTNADRQKQNKNQ